MLQHYILEGKTVKPATLYEWMDWGLIENRDEQVRVCETTLPDGTYISTVFVGTPNCIFETMIFGGEHDGYCERYATWEEAEAGHNRAIELIFDV